MRAAATRPRRLQRFLDCGKTYRVWINTKNPALFKVLPDYCHDRLCPACAKRRALTIRRNLDRALNRHYYRLLTLTLRSSPTDRLETLLLRLTAAFKTLRRTLAWKTRVSGGVAFIELTWNPAGGWHPHLHCLAQGRFFPHHLLKDLWLRCTGDSKIVDVRAVTRQRDALAYCTKYLTKPYDEALWDNTDLATQLVDDLRSKKLIITFGSWRKTPLLAPDRNPDWRPYKHEAAFMSSLAKLTATDLALCFLLDAIHDNRLNPGELIDLSDPKNDPFTGHSP